MTCAHSPNSKHLFVSSSKYLCTYVSCMYVVYKSTTNASVSIVTDMGLGSREGCVSLHHQMKRSSAQNSEAKSKSIDLLQMMSIFSALLDYVGNEFFVMCSVLGRLVPSLPIQNIGEITFSSPLAHGC